MSFSAKYSGRCMADDCNYGDHRINVGDDCEYVDDEVMHAGCATRYRAGKVPLCGSCWQYHKGECP